MFPVQVVYDPIHQPQVDQLSSQTEGSALSLSPFANQPNSSEQVFFRSSDEALYDKILSIVGRVVEGQTGAEAGDILIFLPGEKTIKECLQLLVTSKWSTKHLLYPALCTLRQG